MKNYISDSKLLELTKRIIYDNEETIGIPIGNYTSQYFANIYLNLLDRYIKDKLHIKYYVRYMDDFVMLLNSKEECRLVFDKIKLFLNDNLNLSLNFKSKYYPRTMEINFCGYRIYETHKLLRESCKKNIKKELNYGIN